MSTPYQYPTDITDVQWQRLRPLLPSRRWRRGGPGRPPRDLRLVINGILYRAKTGGQWPMLPPTFGSCQTVYRYFNRWRQDRALAADFGSPDPPTAYPKRPPANAFGWRYRRAECY